MQKEKLLLTEETNMYTIGQVSEMFSLPISTLRYYDKEGPVSYTHLTLPTT